MSNTFPDPSDHQPGSVTPSLLSCYRPLSGKRSRDPGQRKSVSFNDVPIVHEVPSNDAMRNANNETYRSWTATDATIVSPSISAVATQKIQANRLSSALSASTSTSRLPEWATKTTVTEENPSEDKRYTYRAAIIPETEHYRSLPFTYGPVSDSTTTYTSILSTHALSPPDPAMSRAARIRSATLPMHRQHESISITQLRSLGTTSNILSSRAILKPTTIAFQSSPSNSPRLTSATSNNTQTRYSSPTNRMASPTIKYPYAHPTSDTLGPMSLSTAKPTSRSRSANVLSTRRHAASPVPLMNSPSANLLATSKRNPNVRQTYGSHYMHRVLLPAHIN